NIFLNTLECASNHLYQLDITKNTALKELDCKNNHLTSLNVSRNLALIMLWCNYNQITGLDVSRNKALTYLYCNNNNLGCLNLKNRNNYNLVLNAKNNPDLNCIEVDDMLNVPSSWSGSVDIHADYSNNCQN